MESLINELIGFILMDQQRIMIFIEEPIDRTQVVESMERYKIKKHLKDIKIEAYRTLGGAVSGIGHGGERLVIFGGEYKDIENIEPTKFSGDKRLRLSVLKSAFLGSKNLCASLKIPYIFYRGQLRIWSDEEFYLEIDKALAPTPEESKSKTLEDLFPEESTPN